MSKGFHFLSAVAAAVTIVGATATVIASPFNNLDFEDSTYTASSGTSLSAPTALLFPSWTVRFGNSVQTTGSLNIILTAGPADALFTADTPGGNVLQGVRSGLLVSWPTISEVSLAQIGDVPAGTRSIRFQARGHTDVLGSIPPGPFEVAMGGAMVPLVVLSSAGDDFVYGADISAWAGTTTEFRLKVLTLGIPGHVGTGNVDAFAFSPLPIPEPTTALALFAGVAALGTCSRERKGH